MSLEFRPGMMQTLSPDVVVPVERGRRARASSFTRRLLKWAVLLAALVLFTDAAGSLLVRRQHVKQRLNARLAAAFGRSVEVDSYAFNFWRGPTLEANGIRVSEDPRFGHEYFLRADSLSVRLRWLSLLRGRFELESLSLTGPTLNVASNASGDWNLAEWLGHAAPMAASSVGPVRAAFVPRFRAIDVEDGRINFKRGDDKLPFAFIGVVGTISADGPERWHLDLEAAPWRAAELLQQAGTIHLAGSVGGTSSALRPASFELSWTDASASDFMRLMRGEDSGVRGTVAVALNARTAANGWAIDGHADLGQLHRWDMTVRPDSPALSVSAHMSLDVPASILQIADASIDTPHSSVRGSGKIQWAENTLSENDGSKTKQLASPLYLEVQSATIDAADLLSWLRAFRANVPDGIATNGIVRAHGAISGWPAQITSATIETSGFDVSGGTLATPVHLAETRLSYDGHQLSMLPATIAIGSGKSEAGSFRIEMLPRPKNSAHLAQLAPLDGLHLAGGADDAADAIAVASAFGWNVAHGWQIAGPFHCDLRWSGSSWPWKVSPLGTIAIGGTGDDAASLRAAFLNLPVSGLDLRMEWKSGARTVTLAAAQAFGGHWTGTFDRADAAPDWQFALSADKLNAADLDRWLNPRWRESFLDRVLPFLNSPSPANAAPEALRASGRLSVNQLTAAPFVLQGLAGDLTINGRDLALDNAVARLFGGEVAGSFEATLAATPDYEARAKFSGVDLAAWTGGAQQDAAPFGGSASGVAEFSMQGTSRGDFADSLECKGALDVRAATWRGIGLSDSMQFARAVPGNSAFGEASGQFGCSDGAIAVKNVVLSGARAEIDGAGTIDFARNLDLELHFAPGDTGSVGPVQYVPATAQNPVRVTGTADAPQFSKVTAGRRPR